MNKGNSVDEAFEELGGDQPVKASPTNINPSEANDDREVNFDKIWILDWANWYALNHGRLNN